MRNDRVESDDLFGITVGVHGYQCCSDATLLPLVCDRFQKAIDLVVPTQKKPLGYDALRTAQSQVALLDDLVPVVLQITNVALRRRSFQKIDE